MVVCGKSVDAVFLVGQLLRCFLHVVPVPVRVRILYPRFVEQFFIVYEHDTVLVLRHSVMGIAECIQLRDSLGIIIVAEGIIVLS